MLSILPFSKMMKIFPPALWLFFYLKHKNIVLSKGGGLQKKIAERGEEDWRLIKGVENSLKNRS